MASKNSVFATLENLPTAPLGGKIFENLSRNGKGVDLPSLSSDRQLKSNWLNDTIFVSMSNHSVLENDGANPSGSTPSKTYFKFTVGQTPTYSFFFGEDAPYYNAYLETWQVIDIRIQWDKQIIIKLKSGDDDAEITIGKKGMKNGLANAKGSNGWIEQDFKAMGQKGMPTLLAVIAPNNSTNLLMLMNNLKAAPGMEGKAFFETIGELAAKKEGMYFFFAETAVAHLSPQSFTISESLDTTFLIKPSVSFEGAKSIDTKKSFVQFQCIIEQRNDRTDNYTGRDPQDNAIFVSTLQFPGDEALLAPMGTSPEGTVVPCGMNGKEGRTIKDIFVGEKGGIVEQVKITFTDNSTCIFPDAETGTFTATDKETGQMLKGKVEGLIQASGKYKESYAKEKANRIERNISSRWTVFEGEKPVTSSIAWQEGNYLKVIVPTTDGAKLITIPTGSA